MAPSFSGILAVTFFILFFSNKLAAQPKKGEFISVSIGYAMSAPYENIDLSGSGFYAQGEYVFGLTKWFGVRPYLGFISTSPSKSNTQEELYEFEVTSKSVFFGGKARVAIPIPYVAPYIEFGLGASIGSFVTYTPNTNIEKNGLLMHIPFSIGLALGRHHDIEIAFNYYFHNSVDQFNGAATLGMSFPLNK